MYFHSMRMIRKEYTSIYHTGYHYTEFPNVLRYLFTLLQECSDKEYEGTIRKRTVYGTVC